MAEIIESECNQIMVKEILQKAGWALKRILFFIYYLLAILSGGFI
jgi:hypothetical protein